MSVGVLEGEHVSTDARTRLTGIDVSAVSGNGHGELDTNIETHKRNIHRKTGSFSQVYPSSRVAGGNQLRSAQ